ncbi:protein-methionine-sulfoxide reductase heme-binding subunit MsrQ [Cupriavidus gilardii]|uniref:protein-methionine-sulfoxide reductase heme-binding subunit MsrQ n=1 Tax=Cupriavidus gilardii TaxID=82541 RepID=UPI001ABDE2E5|nr:protein-methionine-sulfoxide reductase heme-binding subunit MsrQ [Cupriavidus gilardii]MBO4121864.1 protein-methionine-sulfoxide reductase heme-binding subunit MsrQ [Cupriavidus gilardii]
MPSTETTPAAPRTAAAGGRRASATPGTLSPTRLRALKTLIWVLALLPFARLVYLGATGQYGVNPLEFVTRSTGTWTLVMLCATLAVTPLRRLSGWSWLLRIRRLLGLFAFFYGTLHFLLWLGVDRGFDLAYMAKDVFKRPFITMGFAAFVLMVPLAATSTHAMVRRLGGRRWQALHRSIYAIAVLAILHYWWHKAGKNDFGEVSIYAAVVAALLGARLWWWWRGTARAGANTDTNTTGTRAPSRQSTRR